MRVAAEDGVDAAHARRHLDVHVHAVVRQQDHDLGAFLAAFVHLFLHFFVADAERPVGEGETVVGDRRVGEGLTDNGNLDLVHLADDIRLEHAFLAEAGVEHVLRQELDLALEVLVDDFLDARIAVGEFPVPGHHVDTEQFARVHHVLAVGPERGRRALPGIAAVEQQRTPRAAGA